MNWLISSFEDNVMYSICPYELDLYFYSYFYLNTKKHYVHKMTIFLAPQIIKYTFAVMIWASRRDNLSSGFANNKGADQPVHLHRLISAFVIRFLESIISKLATSNISII